jgi:hypothetical protein
MIGATTNQSGMRPSLRVWPWSARVAVLLVPAVLLTLVVAHGVVRAVLEWPDQRYGGWVLLGIALLSLLPVILLLIELLASAGGSVQLPGLAFSFSGASLQVAATIRSTTLAENLETPSDAPVTQTSLRSVLRALRRAHDSEITIVDLRHGRTWWETRLFILVAGAARLGRPQAIAFVGDRNGKQQVFLGWAPPSRLLDMHLSSMPELADAYDCARAKAAQWRIGIPAPRQADRAPYVTLPWSNQQLWLPPTEQEVPDPAFAEELFLQQELDGRPAELRRHVTIQRLLQLFEPVLVTDRVDVDANDDAWIDLLRNSQRRFFALTTADVLKALVPRDALVAALVARLAVRTAANDAPNA